MTMRFLVIDGYSKVSRDEFDHHGVRLAGHMYEDLAKRNVAGAECDIWWSSDPGSEKAPDDAALGQYTALLWPGCNRTIYDDSDPVVAEHLDLAKRAYTLGIPQFGSCWAIQVAAVAAGGTCRKCPNGREMGFGLKIQLTADGHTHPMMQGKPPVYHHMMSHDDEVHTLPEGSLVLSGNTWSPIQSAVFTHGKGSFWAVQYHPEYNLFDMARLIEAREEKLIKAGYFVDHDDLMAYVEKLDALVKVPDRKDLRWQLRIDEDILDDAIRECEFRNWVRHVLGVEVATEQ
jgi:GMP synthase (glutamine-hydrolysing)